MSLQEQQQRDVPAAIGKVVHLGAGQGPTVWVNGDVYTIKSGKNDGAGSITFLEATVPPGGGPPSHIHTREDETFYVVDGRLEIHADGQVYDATAGDFVLIPRGTVHRFRNTGVHSTKLLIIFTPGGQEEFFLTVGTPADPDTAIPPFDPRRNDLARQVGAALGSPQVPEDTDPTPTSTVRAAPGDPSPAAPGEHLDHPRT